MGTDQKSLPIRVHLCPSVVRILPGNARLWTIVSQREEPNKRLCSLWLFPWQLFLTLPAFSLPQHPSAWVAASAALRLLRIFGPFQFGIKTGLYWDKMTLTRRRFGPKCRDILAQLCPTLVKLNQSESKWFCWSSWWSESYVNPWRWTTYIINSLGRVKPC